MPTVNWLILTVIVALFLVSPILEKDGKILYFSSNYSELLIQMKKVFGFSKNERYRAGSIVLLNLVKVLE